MTQVFKEDKVIPVTLIESGPNFVTQIKTKDGDGYTAIQVGFGTKKEKNIKKPQRGHLKNLDNLRWLREFRVEDSKLNNGDKIDVSDDRGAVGIAVGWIFFEKAHEDLGSGHGPWRLQAITKEERSFAWRQTPDRVDHSSGEGYSRNCRYPGFHR